MSHRYWRGDDERETGRRGRRSRSPVESIVAGSVITLVFGYLLLTRGSSGEWWWVFPAVFAGVLPLVEGIRRALTRRPASAAAAAAPQEDAEKQILRAAQALQGKITTNLAALNTTLSMKQAQEILERMTKEGHAVMNVTSEGIIEFEFPEFLPRREIR
jgi:hypothetical protein